MPIENIHTSLPHAEPMEPADPNSLFAMAVGAVNEACGVIQAPDFVKAILSQPKNDTDFSTAAFCVAVEHVTRAYRQRGIFP